MTGLPSWDEKPQGGWQPCEGTLWFPPQQYSARLAGTSIRGDVHLPIDQRHRVCFLWQKAQSLATFGTGMENSGTAFLILDPRFPVRFPPVFSLLETN